MRTYMNRKIKLLIIDVDGTMTDAGIYYDEYGNELKKFCVKDAVGFFAANKAGIEIMVLTGRECAATVRRMKEMKVKNVHQNIKDKHKFLKQFLQEHHIPREAIGYIGDDLNDFQAMQLAGFVGCPADSCPEIISIANYTSPIKGGYGAVRDIVEHILRKSGEWDEIISEIYGCQSMNNAGER